MEVGAQQARVGGPNPFNIFPELVRFVWIWKKIVASLESPIDLWNLLEAIPQLHEVTKPQEILFDKALPIVFKDLDKKDVLTCREVCKWWKQSVNYFLENHPSQQPFEFSSYNRISDYRYCTLASKNMSCVSVNGSEDLETKLKSVNTLMERHSKAPLFIGRSVSIESGYDNANMEWSEVEDFLSETGTSIWYADFVLPKATRDSATFSNLEYYEGFPTCLAKLPNLKSLSVGEFETYSISCSNFSERILQNGSLSSLELPDIPSLESLELTGYGKWKNNDFSKCHIKDWSPRQDFFHLLLNKYAPQLKKLSMSTLFWKDEYGSRLQQLTELDLDLDLEEYSEFFFKLGGRLEDVPSRNLLQSIFENLNSPNLKKFGITLPCLLILNFLFEEIQTRSFKVLYIEVSADNIDLSTYPHSLTELPSVLSLTLNVTDDAKTLATYFAKYFPNLEYLKIRAILYGMFIFESNLEIAEVWKLYPNLKVFVLNNKTYVREMYERD